MLSIGLPRRCSSHGHDCRVPVAICDVRTARRPAPRACVRTGGCAGPAGDRAGRRPPGRGAGRDQPQSPATPHGREPASAGRGEAGEPGRRGGRRLPAPPNRPRRRPRRPTPGQGRLVRPSGETAPWRRSSGRCANWRSFPEGCGRVDEGEGIAAVRRSGRRPSRPIRTRCRPWNAGMSPLRPTPAGSGTSPPRSNAGW